MIAKTIIDKVFERTSLNRCWFGNKQTYQQIRIEQKQFRTVFQMHESLLYGAKVGF